MSRAQEIRARLGHPVIDSDGHLLEYLPLVRDLMIDEGGGDLARRFDTILNGPAVLERTAPAVRRTLGAPRPPWWGLAPNALDRATAMFPALLRSRLDELGLDFVFLYPTHGLVALHCPDAEFRAVAARAFNRHAVEMCAGLRDRIAPVAIVPAFTPQEALDALHHAVVELGFKAIVLTGLVPRAGNGGGQIALAYDGLGHGAAHDYDPVWHMCQRLDVTPTFHTTAFGFGTRDSADSYVFNHVGGFAAGAEATARSLLFGGVPVRFPGLRFNFMEGGVAWAVALCADVISHLEKRGGGAVREYDPARLDRDLVADLLRGYAIDAVRARESELDDALARLAEPLPEGAVVDELAESGLLDPDAVRHVFSTQFFAGCEVDDPLTCLAFDSRLGHGGSVGALFSSDLGHWDLPDARDLLEEAWAHVESGLLTEEQLRALTFDYPVRAWAGDGLGPFRGTAVEAEVQAVQRLGSKYSARVPIAEDENR